MSNSPKVGRWNIDKAHQVDSYFESYLDLLKNANLNSLVIILNQDPPPSPPSKKILIPMNPPFLWKYFQDLRMNQQTVSSLTEFQVRRVTCTQSHDHVHGTPNCVMMLPFYYVMCYYHYVMCSFYYVIFHTEKHFARRYSG